MRPLNLDLRIEELVGQYAAARQQLEGHSQFSALGTIAEIPADLQQYIVRYKDVLNALDKEGIRPKFILPPRLFPIIPHSSDLAALISHGRDIYGNTTLNALDTARTSPPRGVGEEGIIATIAEIAQIRIKSPKDSRFWTQWYTGLSELDIGTSPQGNSLAVVAHLGILSVPGRLRTAYNATGVNAIGVNGAAPYSDPEFHRLLNGRLPDGSSIDVVNFAEFLRNGSQNLPRRYAVVMDLKEAQKFPTGVQKTGALLDHPVFIAAVGGKEELAQYLQRVVEVRGKDETFCTEHLTTTGPEKAHGRLLFLYNYYHGLLGYDYLYGSGRFLVGSSGGAA